MKEYEITGMSCAACSTRVEKAVSRLEKADSVSVNLLTNSMTVEGDVSSDEVIEAVRKAGYGARLTVKGTAPVQSEGKNIEKEEFKALRNRFAVSTVFLIMLMYISMGHAMWNFRLPRILSHNPLTLGIIELLLTIIIMVINRKFFTGGIKSVIHGAPNMDTLVALGSGASFIYSLYILFEMSDELMNGNIMIVHEQLHNLYFESAAMILTLITLGKTLEAYSKGKTGDALRGLMELAPETAIIIRDGKELEIPIKQLQVGDVFVVKAGGKIPVDGVIIEGECAIDESALTGESIPADKKAGDQVYSATMNKSGYIRCKAMYVGEDTTLSRIIKMVKDASATKAPIAKIADKVSGIFVPGVMAVALITFAVWMMAGNGVEFSLTRAVAVLVISCPCALGLATPVAIMVGNGVGARNKILFKNATALEITGKVKAVALDKTGTITMGEPKVTDVIPLGEIEEREMLSYVNAIEKLSEHPLGQAISEYCEAEYKINENMDIDFNVTQFHVVAGNGIEGYVNKKRIKGGNLDYIKEQVEVKQEILNMYEELSKQGKTPMLFAADNALMGIVAVADMLKPDSREGIKKLKAMGICVVMITGDNEITANAIGTEAEVDRVYAGIKPEGKAQIVDSLKAEYGMTAMVGDGINDAPALTEADVGIAIGAGADIAIDAADVVLVKNSINDVAVSISLSRKVLKNIHENLFWAFFYNVIGIPLAAGVLYPALGWGLNPMFAAAAMSLSSFCVVTNALRLNMYKTKNESEEISMEKKMIIKGMMCGHCEASVKKALEELPEVKEAVVNHKKGTAIVTLNRQVESSKLKAVVEALDYKVISVE